MNQQQIYQDKTKLIDFTGLVGIGVMSIFYSIFGSDFAEIHFQFPGLPCPVFIGEILLLWTVFLFFWKVFLNPIKLRWWHWAWLIYTVWVVAAALCGYVHWGALAFRNAALFYYLLFGFLGYSFYRKEFFFQEAITILSAVILGIIFLRWNAGYFWYTYAVLFLVVVSKIQKKWLRYTFLGLFLFFCISNSLFLGSRSHMMGSFGAVLFVLLCLIYSLGQIRLRWRVTVSFLFILVLFLGFVCFSDKNAVKSLMTPQVVMEEYRQKKVIINRLRKIFQQQPLQTKLYNNNYSDNVSVLNVEHPVVLLASSTTRTEGQDAIVNESESKPIVGSRPLDVAYANIVFRLLIWEDMFDELSHGKFLFGVGLGKPQRSISLEISNWATNEWKRDGWIMPHNSFFHMIYRAGLLGFVVVIGIFACVFYLTNGFFQKKSVGGILLLSILIYWIGVANFLVILELPYNAIPFWALFGMICAYHRDLKINDS